MITNVSHNPFGTFYPEYAFFYQVISADNVKTMGKLIAMRAIKTFIPYAGKVAEKLYRGLIKDMRRSHNFAYIFSDGYDVAQTAICFLCQFMGKKALDICRTNTERKLP